MPKMVNILTLIDVLCVFQFLAISATLDTYIVHVRPPPASVGTQHASESLVSNDDLDRWYRTFLPTTTATAAAGSGTDSPRIVYSYHNVFKGFAARLSAEDVKAMEKKPGFISAKPEKILHLHTTHSPNFLGLNQNMGFWQQSNYGKGVIIGVLDTGIAPGHPSFSDVGMPPPPAKWKGICEFSTLACNKKLIGARFFVNENGSPLDSGGHGTHTSSTAAGNFVRGANVFGNANGTAVGIAPLAHLAMYKVCSVDGCPGSAILAAMDVAIDDGVDILSLSLGGEGSGPFYGEEIAIGAYGAMERGIFVSCSAGNSGPKSFSVSNGAPWILTVGASTTDRKIRSTVVLGNNEKLLGESLYEPKGFSSAQLPLYFPGLDSSNPNPDLYCAWPLTRTPKVRGSIVACLAGKTTAKDKGRNVKAAGGVGLIFISPEVSGHTIQLEANVLPSTHISYADALKLVAYLRKTVTPKAAITFQGTIIGDVYAPEVAAFSSRGPNDASVGILKPDIIGPGVNILAASPRPVDNNLNTKSTFNFLSGTSMSCPHLSGVAALLKSAHPNWSPAAIKSAIMTTAYTVNLGKKPIVNEKLLQADVFTIGSGHVNPSRATSPGLIYDLGPGDYVPYLCGLGYTDVQVGIILGRPMSCSGKSRIAESQLNYPSFSILFASNSNVQKYTRTATNVGEAKSVYAVNVVAPRGCTVSVRPSNLSFSAVNQKLTYEVTFSRLQSAVGFSASQGSLTWTSSKYVVRSPIAAIFL